MKLKKTLAFILLCLFSVTALLACKAKEKPGGEVNYVISKADYDAYLNRIKDPLCLFELNFTTRYENVELKVADGKIEVETAEAYDDNRAIFVPKASTYDPAKGKIDADVYVNAELEGEMVWVHIEDSISFADYYMQTIGLLSDSFETYEIQYEQLRFVEDENVYKYDAFEARFTIKFVNNNIKEFEIVTQDGARVFQFTDVGTTSITVPTDYLEA